MPTQSEKLHSELVHLVARMRRVQVAYYDRGQREHYEEAIVLEARVDALLDEIIHPVETRNPERGTRNENQDQDTVFKGSP